MTSVDKHVNGIFNMNIIGTNSKLIGGTYTLYIWYKKVVDFARQWAQTVALKKTWDV